MLKTRKPETETVFYAQSYNIPHTLTPPKSQNLSRAVFASFCTICFPMIIIKPHVNYTGTLSYCLLPPMKSQEKKKKALVGMHLHHCMNPFPMPLIRTVFLPSAKITLESRHH